MKNNGGLITVSIGLILMVYDYVSNDYEFDGYLRGSIFILLGLIIVFGQYIWGKSMNFYGDFDKFQLVASDSEQLKVLLKGNNWWDRAHINFDFDKNLYEKFQIFEETEPGCAKKTNPGIEQSRNSGLFF